MRIALVTEYYYPHLGGVTEHVHNLAQLSSGRGHPTIVVTAHMRPRRAAHDLRARRRRPRSSAGSGTSRMIYSAGRSPG